MNRKTRNHLLTDPIMAGLIKAVGPYALQPQLELEPFHSLVRAIAHQQLNGTAATRILGRFNELFDGAAFPTPSQVLAAPAEQLRAVGFSFAKILALKDLAAKTLEGVVPTRTELDTLSDGEIIERLTAVRGVGRWTVEMMLIFQLGRPDILPIDDFGVRNGFRLAYGLRGMPLPRALAQFGERWRPHRTMAAWYLWRAVELSRAAKLPRCARAPRIAIKVLAKTVRKQRFATPARKKVVAKKAALRKKVASPRARK